MTLVIAHRGLTRGGQGEGGENSLQAFKTAFQTEGIDGIELDVHSTVEHKLVVVHDPVLPDGTVIAESEASSLELPTLLQVLDLHAIFRTKHLLIELKKCSPQSLFRLARLLEFQARRVDPSKLYVLCFNHDLLRIIKHLVSPSIRTVAHCLTTADMPSAQAFHFVGIGMEHVEECDLVPRKTWVWTRGQKHEAEDAAKLNELGVAGFICDGGATISSQ